MTMVSSSSSSMLAVAPVSSSVVAFTLRHCNILSHVSQETLCLLIARASASGTSSHHLTLLSMRVWEWVDEVPSSSSLLH